MSKRMTQNFRLLLRIFFGALIASGSMAFSEDLSAQDGGFSIFDAAEESNEAPIVVSPKEAFTNPAAKLSKSQFGSFRQANAAETTPQLNGSKAVGPYANDGRSMFKQPPNISSANARNLQPFVSNNLRTGDRPAAAVAEDFQKSARRLPAAPQRTSNATTSEQPEIAQVAFQDGGFSSLNRPQPDNSGSRFGQQPAASRFGNTPTRTQQPLSPRASQSTQQPIREQTAQPRTGYSQSFPNSGRQTAQQPQSGYADQQTTRNNQGPAARVAARPQEMRSARQGQPQTQPSAKSSAAKVGTKAAKELLTGWAETGDSQLKLPGKRMALRQFLAQPINGSRKDAINQYWVTFEDMANHKIAVEQSQWLASISDLRQPADQAVLKAAQQSAENRVLRTEIQLARSQSTLHDFLPNFRYENGKKIPVLPSDIPWVGKLNIKYDEYRSRGMVPDKFNGIDEFLPKSRQLIANGADAVAASSQAAEQAKQALMSGQTPVSNVLEAIRIKSKNQQDFLATVRGYNRAITDYVLTVRQDIYQPDRLASVLIGKNSAQKSVAKQEKPQQDLDPSVESSPTPARQASTSRELPGKSAYQNESMKDQTANRRGQQSAVSNSLSGQGKAISKSSSPFSTASTNQPSTDSKKGFDYGPTADSAVAANFDASKVKEERPMQQAKQFGGSSGYEGNVARSVNATPPMRSASTGSGAQPWNNRGTLGGNAQESPSVTNRPVEQRKTFPNPVTQPAGRFGQGAGSSGNGIGSPNTSRFPAMNSAPANPGSAAPSTSSPFPQSTSATPRPSAADRASSAFGGGTFGGGTGQQPATTPSRIGSLNDSTRR